MLKNLKNRQKLREKAEKGARKAAEAAAISAAANAAAALFDADDDDDVDGGGDDDEQQELLPVNGQILRVVRLTRALRLSRLTSRVPPRAVMKRLAPGFAHPIVSCAIRGLVISMPSICVITSPTSSVDDADAEPSSIRVRMTP